MKDEKPLSPREIARFCHVNFKTVLNWIVEGGLPAHQLPGGNNRVLREDLIEFLEASNLPVPNTLLPELRSQRVLVVDDEEAIRDVIAMSLAEAGFEVDTARDGFDAGFKMMSFEPGLLVLDLAMPGIDGLTIAKKIRKEPRTQFTKLIVISGRLTGPLRREVMRMKPDYILEKPFEPDALLDLVIRLLGKPLLHSLTINKRILAADIEAAEIAEAEAEAAAAAKASSSDEGAQATDMISESNQTSVIE